MKSWTLSKEETKLRKSQTFIESLSCTVYTALDTHTEAFIEARDLKVQRETIAEILNTIALNLSLSNGQEKNYDVENPGNLEISCYIFGSAYEGTSLVDLDSDVDKVMVREGLPVVLNLAEGQRYRECLLMVQDPDTLAGYAKLQFIVNGWPQYLSESSVRKGKKSNLPGVFEADKRNRMVYTLEHFKGLPEHIVHGPAITETTNNGSMDYVFALRCRQWPDCASEWLTRQRQYNWPSQETINYFRSLGCLLVCVGHPNSDETDKEWRLSFSFQERHLVSNFNSVQLKCYILLKMIKREIIHRAVGENSLTSYHLKTCMFYMIENSFMEFWIEDNFLNCVQECLKLILEYAQKAVCPNYFIRGENMFDGKLTEEKRTKLLYVLKRIIDSEFKYLLWIKSSALHYALRNTISSGVDTCRSKCIGFKRMVKNCLLFDTISAMMITRNLIFHEDPGVTSSYCKIAAATLYVLKTKIKNKQMFIKNINTSSDKALSFMDSMVEVSLVSVLTVLARQLHKEDDFLLQVLTSPVWHQISLDSNDFTSKLKQASLLYSCGFHGISLDVLYELEKKLRHQISFCACSLNSRGFDHLCESLISFNISTVEEMLLCHTVPCVLYLPSEIDLTPEPLCYEKLSLDKGRNWQDGAAIDGKVLLYFLMFLNHQHFGMDTNALSNIAKIQWLLETDDFLGHRETAFHILDWIARKSLTGRQYLV